MVSPRRTKPIETWLLYAIRTPKCAPLDRAIYPEKSYHGGVTPWPPWACSDPDGGVHKDNRLGGIDVHLAAAPRTADEISWTCEFQVTLVAAAWLRQLADLVDPTSVGRVFLKDQELAEWATLHEAAPPLVMMKEGWRRTCPICGEDNSVIYGTMFFADPAVLERGVIVTNEGILVRESEAVARGLLPPKGAYKPVRVPYRPDWLSQMHLTAPPVFSDRQERGT
jgi:hypothetical protein